MKLGPKQNLFCQEYANDKKGNGTKAAIKAGYSEKTAAAQATRLLKNVNVRVRIAEIKAESAEDEGITRKYILSKLKRFADADIADYFEVAKSGGLKLKDLSKLPKEKTDCIQEIAQTAYGIRLKLIDKKGSVVDLGNYLGLFEGDKADDKNDKTATVQVEYV